MVRNFKMRKIAIWNWLFALVIMIAIVWTVWETNDYWNLFPLVLPILIVIDERMTRIQVRDNGDIWIRRGLSGSVSQGVWSNAYHQAENQETLEPRQGAYLLHQRIHQCRSGRSERFHPVCP